MTVYHSISCLYFFLSKSLNVYLCIHVCPECLFLYPCLCYSEFMILSGELTFCHGKSPFFMGKSTISMAMFNSYVISPEGIHGKFMEHQGDHSTAPASSDDLSILGTRCWSCNLWGAPTNEGIMNLLEGWFGSITGWSWNNSGWWSWWILHHSTSSQPSKTTQFYLKQRLACSNGWWLHYLHWRYQWDI